MVKTQSQHDTLQHKLNFIYSIVPFIHYIKIKYNHNYFDEVLFRGIIELYGYNYGYEIRNNIVYVKRWKSIDDLYYLKTDKIVETGTFHRAYSDMYNEIVFPLQYKFSFWTQTGFLTFYKYKRHILKQNYCFMCEVFVSRLKSHNRSRKHKHTKHCIINEVLGNKLNMDCVNSICDFL